MRIFKDRFKLSENKRARRRANIEAPSYCMLEDRQLLCTDVFENITEDTVWNDECYVVTGSFEVNSGVTLTISPDVVVTTNRNIDDVIVKGALVVNDADFRGNNNDIRAEDNGRIDFNGGSFAGERVLYFGEAVGSVSNVRFNSGLLVIGGNVSMSGNTFASDNPIQINPSYADELYNNNVFEVGATVNIAGTVVNDAELRAIENLSRFEVISTVEVNSGVTLTISPDVIVTTNRNIDDVVVRGTLTVNDADFRGNNNDIRAEDNGRIDFSGGSFAGERVLYFGEAVGSVSNVRFNSGLLVIGGNVSMSGNTFASDNPIQINPSYADELYNNNVFEVGATVNIAGTVVNDAELRAIENLSRFEVISTVEVNSGVTLTISPDVIVTTNRNIDDVVVRGTLVVNDADFRGNNNDIRAEDNGRIDFSGGSFAGERVLYFGEAVGSVSNVRFNSGLLIIGGNVSMSDNTFASDNPIQINPSYADELYNNNVFEVGATVNIAGAVVNDAELRAIENLSRFEVVRTVEISSGVTLTISPDVVVTTSRNIDDVVVRGTLMINDAGFAGDLNDVRVESNGRLEFNSGSFAGDRISISNGASIFAECSEIDSDELNLDGGASVEFSRSSILSSIVRATGNATQTIDLRGNYWGTIDPNAIRQIITDNEDDSELPVVDFAGFLLSQPACEPELLVTGLGERINDDDLVPSETDGTDFGVVREGNIPANRVFVVRNLGDVPLLLSDLTVPKGFSILEGLSGSIAPGGSDTFTVQLESNSIGEKQGEIKFESNDADEQSFNFAIQGEVKEDDSRLTLEGTPEADQFLVEIDDSEITATINGISESFPIGPLDSVFVDGLANTDTLQVFDLRDNRPIETDLTVSNSGFRIGALQFAYSELENVFVANENEGGNALIEAIGRDNQMNADASGISVMFGGSITTVRGYEVLVAEGSSQDQLDVRGTAAGEATLLRSGGDNLTIVRSDIENIAIARSAVLVFDGSGGSDTLRYRQESAPVATAGNLSIGVNSIADNGVRVRWINTENVAVIGRDGSTGVELVGSAGDDELFVEADADRVTLSGIGYRLVTSNFLTYEASGQTGNDSARFSAGDSIAEEFISTFNVSQLSSASSDKTFLATGFELAAAVTSDSRDVAQFTGTTGADQFYGGFGTARMVGRGYVANAEGFAVVRADSGGGFDEANLADTEGNDSFAARPGFAELKFGKTKERIQLTGFRQVITKAFEGNDSVTLFGSLGDERFVGSPSFGRLFNDSFDFRAIGFSVVKVVGEGGADAAFLNDSPEDDVFVSTREMTFLRGDGFDNSVVGFTKVNGFASDGYDVALMSDTNGDDRLFSMPAFAHLTGDALDNYVGGFDFVRATSSGGDDLAIFRDSAGDDRFVSTPDLARLSGAGYKNEAVGFARTRAIALAGGSDSALLEGSAESDRLVAFRDSTSMESNSHFSQVNGFGKVQSFGLAGVDEAFVFDSEFDDQFVGRDGSAWVQWGNSDVDQAFEFETVGLVGAVGGGNEVFLFNLLYELNRNGHWG